MAGDIRIYTDEHIANAIVTGLRGHGIDVRTFREAGLAGASDREHIERAHSEGRAVLTKDPDLRCGDADQRRRRQLRRHL